MDLALMKAKLESLNSNQREKIDYDALLWKVPKGKSQIRIVPSAYDPTFPFKELKFHYNIAKFPMIALSNFGKQDPIDEFVQELKKTDDKENWKLAGRLTSKVRVFAPVIVRGEEEKGVRLWSFGKNIYKALLSLAEDEDVGDYTDLMQGFDLIVEQTPGNPYPETTVRIKPKTCALSKDNKQVETWLKEQPNPDTIFPQQTYDFMKKQLQNFLSPSSEDEDEPKTVVTSVSTDDLEEEEEAPKVRKTQKAAQAAASSFDELFPD